MEETSRLDELLEVYTKSLEAQIENKKYFLKQAQDAIEALSLEPNPENPAVSWHELLKRPMFYPERSDPIGLSLASVSQTSRKETTEEWINYMDGHLAMLKCMVEDQKQTNHDLNILIELLQRRPQHANSSDREMTTLLPEARNQQLLADLKDFIKNYLSVDIVNAEDAGSDLSDIIFSLIMRLIDRDKTLQVTDFHYCSMGLYRLLLRSNLITIIESGDNTRRVELLDFASHDLS